MSIYPINVEYNADDKTIKFVAVDSFDFTSIKVIHFGSTSLKDVNFCDPLSYQYQISGGKIPDLSGSSTSFILEHVAKTLPNL